MLRLRAPLACLNAKQPLMQPLSTSIFPRAIQRPACVQLVLSRFATTRRQHPASRVPAAARSLAQDLDDASLQRQALQQLPKAAFGQVISAEANYVRVNISHLDTAASPDGHSSSSTGGKVTAEEQQANAQRRAHHLQDTTSYTIKQDSSSSSSNGSTSPLQPPRTQLLCTVRALLKKINQRVLVGDRVRVQGIDWLEGRGVVESVQPRSSELADPAIANVDHVVLLFGLTQPPFEPQQVSRFLVSVGKSGLPITLALNKCDLLPSSEVQARIEQAAAWGYTAIAVSCETGQGLEQLAQALQGAVSVVAGPSGAGKSSLINALRLGRHKPDAAGSVQVIPAAAADGWQQQQQQLQQQQQHNLLQLPDAQSAVHCFDEQLPAGKGSEQADKERIEDDSSSFSSSSSSSSSSTALLGGSTAANNPSFLAVGDVSRLGRGRHTTRTVTLIKLPFGGLMADTPGFNQPTLDRVESTGLAALFPEFVAAMDTNGGCRFADCMHVAEPGCAVTGSAAQLERYEHYIKFLAEIKAREEYDVRVMQLAKQRREGNVKVITGRGGTTRYEARLDRAKHRATSRRKMKQTLWDEKE